MQFENLIEGLGPGCKNPMMYPEIRFFYCLGCDPRQPDYTVSNGDGDDTWDDIRVCKSFLEKLWRDPAYEECGVMYSNECPEWPGNWDFDPYMCGDTLLLPKDHFNNNVTAFINTFKPPGLEDARFVMIDDTIDPDTGARRDSTPCWTAATFQSSSAARRAGSSSAGWAATAAVAVAVAAALPFTAR